MVKIVKDNRENQKQSLFYSPMVCTRGVNVKGDDRPSCIEEKPASICPNSISPGADGCFNSSGALLIISVFLDKCFPSSLPEIYNLRNRLQEERSLMQAPLIIKMH